MRLLSVGMLLALPAVSFAQQPGQIQLPSFDGLEKQAVNSVNISLDLWLLRLVAQTMDNPQDQEVKSVLSGLQGIYVRSFQFATDHAYPQGDVDRVLRQLDAAGWNKFVSVHNTQQQQDVEVSMRRDGNRVEGLVVVARDPRQFTIVNIVGSIDMAKLSQLQGKFGVPDLHLGQKGVTPGTPQPNGK